MDRRGRAGQKQRGGECRMAQCVTAQHRHTAKLGGGGSLHFVGGLFIDPFIMPVQAAPCAAHMASQLGSSIHRRGVSVALSEKHLRPEPCAAVLPPGRLVSDVGAQDRRASDKKAIMKCLSRKYPPLCDHEWSRYWDRAVLHFRQVSYYC